MKLSSTEKNLIKFVLLTIILFGIVYTLLVGTPDEITRKRLQKVKYEKYVR